MTQVALELTPELAHIHRKLEDGGEIGWAAFIDALQSWVCKYTDCLSCICAWGEESSSSIICTYKCYVKLRFTAEELTYTKKKDFLKRE